MWKDLQIFLSTDKYLSISWEMFHSFGLFPFSYWYTKKCLQAETVLYEIPKGKINTVYQTKHF